MKGVVVTFMKQLIFSEIPVLFKLSAKQLPQMTESFFKRPLYTKISPFTRKIRMTVQAISNRTTLRLEANRRNDDVAIHLARVRLHHTFKKVKMN